MNPTDKYNARVQKSNSLLCVGLDADFKKLPERFQTMANPQFEFNKYIIEQTHQYVSAYKPNSAFYEARGEQGIAELKMTIDYLNQNHPDIFTILDAKRADIGNTNNGYMEFAYDYLGFDALTVNPYMGGEAIAPILDRSDKTAIILCRTSNPGSKDFQDLEVQSPSEQSPSSRLGTSVPLPLWQYVAEKVSQEWNTNNNCMMVVGATYPEEMQKIREIAGDMTFLVPGIGAQGGDIKSVLGAGLNSQKSGLILSASRSVIFANDPAMEAGRLRDEINSYK